MKPMVGLLLSSAMLCAVSHAQPRRTFANYRIFPSSVPQTEPVVTVHPTNPDTMCVASRTVNGAWGSEGVYVTTNGGTTWPWPIGSDSCKGQSIDNHGGDPGVAFHQSGSLILTHIGSVFRGLYSHYSTDLGRTWSNAYTIFYQDIQPVDDKGQTTAIDNNPASPFYGRLYTAWAIVGSPFTILSSYSTNGAQTWTTPTTANPSPPARCSGTFTTVGLNGKVYVNWVGIAAVSPFAEDFVGLAMSTNGGVNWRVTQNAYDMNGILGIYPSKNNIRLNGLPQLDIDRSGGPRNGWLYIATGEKNLAPAGSDPDIILHRSTDDGVTWSSGIRVNQDPLNNGKFQFFPAVDVDSQGGLNIIYYDDRNTSADSSEMFLSRSLDGGNTWSEWVISGHRFKPTPLQPSGYMGDHIALTSVGNILWPFWMDNSSGIYQIWTCPIDLTTLDVRIENPQLPSVIELKPNYPNPFNPSTTIDYDLNRSGFVSLRIIDLNGREVARLVNERQQAGQHRVVFDANQRPPGGRSPQLLPSGVYFYQLTFEGFKQTKEMLLLK